MSERTAPLPWRRVDVPGNPEIAADRIGSGDAPLVAIHGLGTQRRCFNFLARDLQHPDGILAMDLRGRGETPWTPGRGGLEMHADDVIRVMDAAGIQRTVLLGHSMGAYVALAVARRHPGRVAGVVLVDGGWPAPTLTEWLTPGPWLDTLGASALMGHAAMRMQRRESSIEEHARRWAALAGEREPSEDTLDFARHDVRPSARGGWVPKVNSLAVASDAWLMPLQAPYEQQLRDVRCPVVLVHAGAGATAGSRPLLGRRALAAMRRSLRLRDVAMPDATHYSVILGDHATRLGRIATEFARDALGRSRELGA